MVFSRAQAKTAFNHILDEVLGRGDNSALKTSLIMDGIEDIFGLASIDLSTINELHHTDASGQRVPVPKGDKSLVRIFRDYIVHCHNSGTPIDDQWTSITQDAFDAFRVDPIYLSSTVGITNALVSTTRPSPTTFLSNKYSPADLF